MRKCDSYNRSKVWSNQGLICIWIMFGFGRWDSNPNIEKVQNRKYGMFRSKVGSKSIVFAFVPCSDLDDVVLKPM